MTIYLYVKQHSVTGLKYFGKTTHNPHSYLGSGRHWKSHLKQHGKGFVETIELYEFHDQEEATAFALEFSEKNQIVESQEWANLIVEDAKRGGGLRNKSSPLSGKTYEEIHGKEKSDELKKQKRLSALGNKSSLGFKQTNQTKIKIALSKLGKPGTTKNRMWVNDGSLEKLIEKINPSQLKSFGFSQGRLKIR